MYTEGKAHREQHSSGQSCLEAGQLPTLAVQRVRAQLGAKGPQLWWGGSGPRREHRLAAQQKHILASAVHNYGKSVVTLCNRQE